MKRFILSAFSLVLAVNALQPLAHRLFQKSILLSRFKRFAFVSLTLATNLKRLSSLIMVTLKRRNGIAPRL